MIENDQGQIALRHHQPNQVLLQGNPTKADYVFVVKAAISMAWLDPADVPYALSKRGGCCNSQRQLFDYANEAAVRQWTNGGGA